ncbi:hypothetical protein GJ496_008724 [Pomphorhynchus laevis]|nr:hypothetical protein GJ496_005383 [Pomphorhynchus laevis]KAI0983058.1 hypothetical protein GJ496_008724 [Pomphorhynchus laevis]
MANKNQQESVINVQNAGDPEEDNKLDDRLLKIGKDALTHRQETLTNTRSKCTTSFDDALTAYKSFATNNIISEICSVKDAIYIFRSMGYCGSDREFYNLLGKTADDEEVDISYLRSLVDGQQGSNGRTLKKYTSDEIAGSVKSFESKTNRGMINILELSYILQGRVGEPISKDDFNRILLDLDFNETSGMVPITTVLHLFGGSGGKAPGIRQAERRRIIH